ncbi:hypothetical protein ABZ807_05510 [Micromonospora sp. NPDC047548]|uniref:hypothetical protein n=1 Tax=Micromonospora sp. NPDC047548 TaxID=3155624 RepID=UPI003406F5D1
MANQVTLTFAGEDKQLTDSFGRVGGAARDMGREVEQAGSSFDRAGEAADSVDTKAMGFRDTLTGVEDGMKGIKMATEDGLGFESLLLLGFGIGDLASGMYNLLIPAMKSAVTWFRATTVGQYAAAAASKVWAAAQWLFNAAMWANPITWIVIGIIALIAVIVLIAVKTDWFSKAWRASWEWIKKAASNTWDFLKKIPGWTGDAFKKVADFITRPYKTAFNLIARAWNATIGKLSWTVPSWIPGIGGNTISVPNLPTFHAGGRVPGAPGQNVLAMLQAGETVTSAAGSGGGTLTIDSAGSRLDDLLVEVLRRSIKRGGGNVQVVLGGGTT